MEVSFQNQEKIAFTTGSELCQFTVMSFRLGNAPVTSERLMETVLCGLICNICLVYMDDVVIFGSTVNEFLQHLCIVFEKL